MDDGFVNAIRLFGSIAIGKSNQGNRTDGKICTAQGGECRYNGKYYTPGMNDDKSWKLPVADDTCPSKCWALK